MGGVRDIGGVHVVHGMGMGNGDWGLSILLAVNYGLSYAVENCDSIRGVNWRASKGSSGFCDKRGREGRFEVGVGC